MPHCQDKHGLQRAAFGVSVTAYVADSFFFYCLQASQLCKKKQRQQQGNTVAV